MDFIDELRALSTKIVKLRDKIETEEATKQAFVLPFIQMLGYEVWDPTEVVPEFTADVGIKKGEKVDYAICKDGKPIILIECKHCNVDLNRVTITQLYRYFSVVEARVAILTNGITYKFFTDVDEPNKMDSKPFLEFDLLEFEDASVPELKKLAKGSFDLETMLTTAVELKYTREIKKIISDQFNEPEEELVRFFAAKVYTGKLTQTVRDQFGAITKRALHQFLNERIAGRLKSALQTEEGSGEFPGVGQVEPLLEDETSEIVTTEEELEGFMIVKAILREVVDLARVAPRDTKSYFGVLLDDNNRKPICRLRFNSAKQKYLGLFDGEKNETRFALEKLDDIYKYAEQLKQTALRYDETPAVVVVAESTITMN